MRKVALLMLAVTCTTCAANCYADTAVSDPNHSIAYNVTHSVGMTLKEGERPPSAAGNAANGMVAGAEAGSLLTRPSLAGGGIAGANLVLGLMSSSQEQRFHIIGWPPASLAPNALEAKDVMLRLYAEAANTAMGKQWNLSKTDSGSYWLAAPDCGKNSHDEFERGCSFLFFHGKEIIPSADLSQAPSFVQTTEQVYGPVGIQYVVFLHALDLDQDRDLAVRVSALLPPWMFLYLPGRHHEPTVVLNCGQTLYFYGR